MGILERREGSWREGGWKGGGGGGGLPRRYNSVLSREVVI